MWKNGVLYNPQKYAQALQFGVKVISLEEVGLKNKKIKFLQDGEDKIGANYSEDSLFWLPSRYDLILSSFLNICHVNYTLYTFFLFVFLFLFLMRVLCLILVQLYQYRVCLLNNVLESRLIRFNTQYKTSQILSDSRKRSGFFWWIFCLGGKTVEQGSFYLSCKGTVNSSVKYQTLNFPSIRDTHYLS